MLEEKWLLCPVCKSKTRIKRLEKAAVECDKMFSIDKKQIMFIKRK